MDGFSDIESSSSDVGAEVNEVETPDADFGDGDGVNDFDDTYESMNNGDETMEYSQETPENQEPVENINEDTDTAVDEQLNDFDDVDETVDITEVPDTAPAGDNVEQTPSDMTTDENVDDALSDFEDDDESSESDVETITDETGESDTEATTAETGESDTETTTGETSGSDSEETADEVDTDDMTDTEETADETDESETENAADETDEADTEDTTDETGEADTEPTAAETGELDTETTTDETGEADSEETADETDEANTEDTTDETDEADIEPTAAETDESETEDTADETDESDAEDTTDETGEADTEPTAAETGEPDTKSTMDETGESDTEPTTDETGEADSEETADETDEANTEDTTDETDEADTESTADETDEVDTDDMTNETDTEDTADETDAEDTVDETSTDGVNDAAADGQNGETEASSIDGSDDGNNDGTDSNSDTECDHTEKNAVFENVSYHQGQNDLGALGTCGPTSIANSLNRVTGSTEYTENKVLHNAMDNNLCYKSDNPYSCGGTTTRDVVNIIDNVKNLDDHIHTEVYEYDKALSVEDLANRLDDPGTVAMVGVDSATLWDQRGDVACSGLFQHTDSPSDHWITVDSPIRDEAGNLTGFNVIDSGGGVSEVSREKFETMYMGDASHTVSDPTAILISNTGGGGNTFTTSEGVERTSNYKGSSMESDGGDPPIDKKTADINETEKLAKMSFDEKFAERRDSWVDDDKAKEFIDTSDMYAQKAVDSGACSSKEDFYKMYESGDYSYEKDFVDKVKEPYLESGASSLVSNRDVINAFDNPRCQSTIGRQEYGNFVTSMKEDNALIYDTSGGLKNKETIEQIKGVDPGKYDAGVYQYSYDSMFVNDCENKGLIRTVNGDNPGSNSFNIPGCQTWAGEHSEYSESELLMPSIDVSGYNSEDVFKAIDEKGYFEIQNPTVVTEGGTRVQVNGIFRINRLGE